MSNLEQISFAEQVLHEIERIRRQLDALQDFVCSKIDKQEKPKTGKMIDPRNGSEF